MGEVVSFDADLWRLIEDMIHDIDALLLDFVTRYGNGRESSAAGAEGQAWGHNEMMPVIERAFAVDSIIEKKYPGRLPELVVLYGSVEGL